MFGGLVVSYCTMSWRLRLCEGPDPESAPVTAMVWVPVGVPASFGVEGDEDELHPAR